MERNSVADYRHYTHERSLGPSTRTRSCLQTPDRSAFRWSLLPVFWGVLTWAAVLVWTPLGAQCPLEPEAMNVNVSEWLASDMDLGGDLLVLGAPGNDTPGNNDGSAHVFRRLAGQWQWEAELVPGGSWSGLYVAVEHQVTIEGVVRDVIALGGDSGQNQAYLYQHVGGSGWVPMDSVPFPCFTHTAVDLHGGTLVVGVKGCGTLGSGQVRTFQYTGTCWELIDILVPDPFGYELLFGNDVSLDGGLLAVGAPEDDAIDYGSVHVYEQVGGSWERALLQPASGTPGDRFGHRVHVSGDRLVVGAWGNGVNGPNSGRAYVYLRTGPLDWVLEQEIEAPNPGPDQFFGRSVAISGALLAVGSAGAIHIFERQGTEWVWRKSEESNEPSFGASVAVDGTTLVGGAPFADTYGSDSGTVFIIETQQQNCFVRGDANSDSQVGLADAVHLLNFAFVPGTSLLCLEASDVDSDGVFVGLVDALALLNYLFQSGFPPPGSPFPECGSDPDPAQSLGCSHLCL